MQSYSRPHPPPQAAVASGFDFYYYYYYLNSVTWSFSGTWISWSTWWVSQERSDWLLSSFHGSSSSGNFSNEMGALRTLWWHLKLGEIRKCQKQIPASGGSISPKSRVSTRHPKLEAFRSGTRISHEPLQLFHQSTLTLFQTTLFHGSGMLDLNEDRQICSPVEVAAFHPVTYYL